METKIRRKKTGMFRLAGLAALMLAGWGCSRKPAPPPVTSGTPAPQINDYRGAMRQFVAKISARARRVNPQFIVIPQNGHTLLSQTVDSSAQPAREYLAAIDGVGQEDLFYGLTKADQPTPAAVREYLWEYLKIARAADKPVLVIDYCSTPARVDDSYQQNQALGLVSFAADRRELDAIPRYPAKPFRENAADVTRLGEVKNFLYLVNPDQFKTKADFLRTLERTNYDLVVVDPCCNDETLTATEVAALKKKAGGSKRLVLAYLSIGEAEDYRGYWQKDWAQHPPAWLDKANPDWPGCYKVKYWDPAWQEIVVDGPHSSLQQIVQAGFDGVYLDVVDAFEFFEEK